MDLEIRRERKRRGWTQEYVANQAGITRPMLQLIETGQRRPSFGVLVKLLELFEHTDPRALLAPAPEEPHNPHLNDTTD